MEMSGPNLINVSKLFKKYFGVEERTFTKEFWDKNLTLYTGKIKIKLFVFDDFLHLKHGNYEEADMSMKDVIRKMHGEDAEKLIQELL